MSDIKIQPSATGSATVTLTAPVSNTARTITLPDSTSTLLASDGSAANLTAIPAANITGTLPAISGASLTNLPADSTKLPLAGGTLTGQLNLIQSTSGTGSSAVKQLIYNEGAGDAALQLALSGSIDWYMGADNTDNSLKLGQASWDSSPYLTINTDGYVQQNKLPHMFWHGGDNFNNRTLGAGEVFFNTNVASQAAIDYTGSATLTGQSSYGITYASGTGRFTVPVAGRYYISAYFMYAEATDQAVQVAIYTNNNHAVCYNTVELTHHQTIQIIGCANLAANDYIDFRNVTGNRTFFMADTHTGGSIFFIG